MKTILDIINHVAVKLISGYNTHSKYSNTVVSPYNQQRTGKCVPIDAFPRLLMHAERVRRMINTTELLITEDSKQLYLDKWENNEP